MRGEILSTYPRRPKAEAYSNAVDVVERLCDPTDQVLNSRHLRDLHMFNSVMSLELLDLAEVEGEFCQHDGVLTVMLKLPSQGFA